jgi:hypothetical protein
MYVRMISYSIRPSVNLEQAETIYEEMRDLMEPLSGYQGLSLLINDERRQAISLSYWQDQESATEAGSEVLPLLMERTQDLVDGPPEVAGFDFVRQDLPAD